MLGDNKMEKIFFIDFDGTITKIDTIVAVVNAFAADGWKEINEMWERKEFTTEECANRVFRLLNAAPADLKRLLENIEIDDYFLDFLTFCGDRGYKAYVLSDGYDFHIETVFDKYGIDLPYYANRLISNNDGFQISCTYANPSCGKCGTCKTALIKKLNQEGRQVIYIGDGYSDTCPAEQADLIFAKDVLYEYCVKHGIAAIHFDNFRDILIEIKHMTK